MVSRRRRSRNVRRAALLAAAILAPLACSGSDPTDPSSGLAPRSGEWQGTTGQGKSISFSVGGTAGAPRITRYEITVRIDELDPPTGPFACLSSETSVSVQPANIPIVNGAFAIEVGAIGARIRFAGLFDSVVSAAGELSAESTPGSTCPGRGRTTWVAEPV